MFPNAEYTRPLSALLGYCQDIARPSRNLPDASPRFAHGASKVFLVRETPTPYVCELSACWRLRSKNYGRPLARSNIHRMVHNEILRYQCDNTTLRRKSQRRTEVQIHTLKHHRSRYRKMRSRQRHKQNVVGIVSSHSSTRLFCPALHSQDYLLLKPYM